MPRKKWRKGSTQTKITPACQESIIFPLQETRNFLKIGAYTDLARARLERHRSCGIQRSRRKGVVRSASRQWLCCSPVNASLSYIPSMGPPWVHLASSFFCIVYCLLGRSHALSGFLNFRTTKTSSLCPISKQNGFAETPLCVESVEYEVQKCLG